MYEIHATLVCALISIAVSLERAGPPAAASACQELAGAALRQKEVLVEGAAAREEAVGRAGHQH